MLYKLPARPITPCAITSQPEIALESGDSAQVYVIPRVDRTAYDRLALIITRLDSSEAADPAGIYSITLD